MNLDHLAQLATKAQKSYDNGISDHLALAEFYEAAANPSVVLALVEVAQAAMEVAQPAPLDHEHRALRDALAKLDNLEVTE